ncbi:MAG: hypothetical protein J2P45_04250 [Candidatus Dormibacteraeota bacterium]|nr:hypothetical protein [Candidatus Dormibacteraeota bacterium]
MLLLLAGCSPTSASSAAPSLIKVAYTFKAGDTYRYRFNSASNSSLTIGSKLAATPMAKGSADVTWKVASVDKSGNATIDLTLSNLKSTFSPSQHYRFQVKPTGEIVSGNPSAIGSLVSSSGQGLGPPGTDQFLAILPGRAIKPGDSWSRTFTTPGPYGQGNITYTSESRFLRYENLSGGRAAVIQTKTTVPLDISVDPQTFAGTAGAASPAPPPVGGTVRIQATDTNTATIWFDVRTGQVTRLITVSNTDQTTTVSGITGQAPPGIATDANGHPLSPMHEVGSLTLRFDLVPSSR